MPKSAHRANVEAKVKKTVASRVKARKGTLKSVSPAQRVHVRAKVAKKMQGTRRHTNPPTPRRYK